MDTKVNEQITDSVTQANVKVVGESPAMALGNVYQTAAHSTGLMFQNAVNAQNQQNILAQAAGNQGSCRFMVLILFQMQLLLQNIK